MPVLGGGGGAADDTLSAITATPAFDGTSARNSNWGQVSTAFRFWGFNADGDYIDVYNNAVSYYNSGQTLQWSVAPSDVDATANNFAAATKHGDYLYVVATVNASLNAWIAMVDSTGTVSNVTAITTTTTSNTFKQFRYTWLGVPNGETSLYFVGQGYEAKSFNLTTLATVQTTTPTDGYYGLSAFLTSNLQSIGFNDILNSTYGAYGTMTIGGPQGTLQGRIPFVDIFNTKFGNNLTSIGLVNDVKFLYWDGYVIPAATSSGQPQHALNIAYSIADFDDFAVNFLKEVGAYKDNTGAWS